jgi:hypothetical protein
MGRWGPKIYEDDLTQDIKEDYKRLLQQGKTNEETINEILSSYEEEIKDIDEGPVFWIAFADTLWDYGRLTEEIKEKAIQEIELGNNLNRWKEEGTLKEYKIRERELEKLKEKLNKPMPKEKKIIKLKKEIEVQQEDKYKWKIGDTYAYKITSKETKDNNLIGRYIILRKVDEYESNKIYETPILYIQITNNNQLPTKKEELEKLEYIIAINEGNIRHQYRMRIDGIPKKKKNEIMIYIGNFMDFITPKDEYIEKEKINMIVYSFKNINYVIDKVNNLGTDKKPVYYEVKPENVSDSYVRFLMRLDYYEKALNIVAPKGESVKENPLLYIALVDSMMIGGFVKNPVGIVGEKIKQETYKRIKELKDIINSSSDNKQERIQVLDKFEKRVREYTYML